MNRGHGTLQLWDTEEKQNQKWKLYVSPIQSMIFSPDGTSILLGLANASCILIDVESGTQIQRLPFTGFPGWKPLEWEENVR